MNVIVIGLGSMGKRRIRLIKEMYPEYHIIGVDGRKDRRDESYEAFQINSYESIDDVQPEDAECAFICTSPLSHSMIISECLKKKWNIFTELNLVSDGYEENIQLAQNNKCTLFLSSTFIYREELKYIRNKLDRSKQWNYIYHIGQYLPDWHPWESYKNFFIGDKRTNGCREILAIELPWLIKAFGEIETIMTTTDKMTALDIDFNDNYMIQVNHKDGNKGMLVVDVVSPIAVRKFEAYAENAYLSWNGTPDSICEFNPVTKELEAVHLSEKTEHKDGYSAFIVENAYKNEIREFFNVVHGTKDAIYDFEQDLITLKLIDSTGA